MMEQWSCWNSESTQHDFATYIFTSVNIQHHCATDWERSGVHQTKRATHDTDIEGYHMDETLEWHRHTKVSPI